MVLEQDMTFIMCIFSLIWDRIWVIIALSLNDFEPISDLILKRSTFSSRGSLLFLLCVCFLSFLLIVTVVRRVWRGTTYLDSLKLGHIAIIVVDSCDLRIWVRIFICWCFLWQHRRGSCEEKLVDLSNFAGEKLWHGERIFVATVVRAVGWWHFYNIV